MIHLDHSIIYQIVLFVVLWLILNKLLFQPYLRLLAERENKTTGAQHDSVDLEYEGAKLKAQFDEKIAQGQAVGYAAKEAINQESRRQRGHSSGGASPRKAATISARFGRAALMLSAPVATL